MAIRRKIKFYDADGNEVLENISVLELRVSPSKTFSKNTLEDGTVVSDNEIDNQTQISVTGTIKPSQYYSSYQELLALYEKNTEFQIQGKVDTYTSMYIDSMPHQETGEKANTVDIVINFIEQQIAGSSTVLSTDDVSNSNDSDTVKSGTKTTSSADSSILASITDKFTNATDTD